MNDVSRHDSGRSHGSELRELSSVGCEELRLKTLVTATVDRLLHHAHLYRTSDDSIHLAQPLPERESLR